MEEDNLRKQFESLKQDIEYMHKNRNTEIELIRKDLTNLIKIYDKMDVAFEKLQQVSADLTKMLTSHDYRLQTSDKTTADIKIEYEKINDKIEKLTGKMEQVISVINDKVIIIEHNISEEIDFLKKEMNISNNRALIDEEQIKNQREALKELKSNVESNYTTKELFSPVQKIVYGVTAFILTAVVGLIINQILKGH